MAATRQEISTWFDTPYIVGATHMLVVCDEFDWEDYPVYAVGEEAARIEYARLHQNNMQRVMEVYDLRKDKTAQLNEHRAHNF